MREDVGHLSKRIAQRRAVRKFNLYEAAECTGIPVYRIEQIEDGVTPSLPELIRLAEGYGVPLSAFTAPPLDRTKVKYFCPAEE